MFSEEQMNRPGDEHRIILHDERHVTAAARAIFRAIFEALEEVNPEVLAEVSRNYAKPDAQLDREELVKAIKATFRRYVEDGRIDATLDDLESQGNYAEDAAARMTSGLEDLQAAAEELTGLASKMRDLLPCVDDMVTWLADGIEAAPVIRNEERF